MLAWTDGSTSAIASMAARIPLPIAVRRPVVRLRRAAWSATLSLVGDWTIWAKPLNATIPIWVLGALVLDERGGRGPRRPGAGSARCRLEHMLPDTSMTRTIVVWLVGTRGDRDRPADREAQRGERHREQRERQVPPPARPEPGCAAWTSDRLE